MLELWWSLSITHLVQVYSILNRNQQLIVYTEQHANQHTFKTGTISAYTIGPYTTASATTTHPKLITQMHPGDYGEWA
jgi:hypothetical protein